MAVQAERLLAHPHWLDHFSRRVLQALHFLIKKQDTNRASSCDAKSSFICGIY